MDPVALESLRDVLSGEERVCVANYLRSGTVIIPLMEYTEDVLGGAFGVPGGSGVLSDGKFYWRGDAAEYVAAYGVDVGTIPLDHMRRQGWVAPELLPSEVAEIDSILYRMLRSGT